MNIFIIHGAYGNPGENWIPWLRINLEKRGYNVFSPSFPTPENQNLENWLRVFEGYRKYLKEDSILIGHSIGVAFLLNILEGIDFRVRASYLVSGFIELLDNPNFDNINKTFINKGFDFNKIKSHSKDFIVFHGDNDPYVSLEKSQNLADKLGVKVNLISGAGHFNIESGYDHFDVLLEDIKRLK